MSEEPKYKVTLDGLTFYAYLYRADKKRTFLRLGILPSGACCVEVEIKKEREFILLGVQFDTGCTISKDMERGDNTRTMVNATLQLLKTLYPECKKLKIQDSSHIDCSGLIDSVSLANNNFLKYGKTWYQRYFNATYKGNDEDVERVNNSVITLQSKPSYENLLVFQQNPSSNYSSWNEYFQTLSCEKLHRIETKVQNRLYIKDMNGSNWVIKKFPKNKTIKIERGDSINLQSGGFRRMIL